jgi:hypothetical protein
LHASPHAVPSHVGDALAGVAHAVQLVPHVASVLFAEQVPLQL